MEFRTIIIGKVVHFKKLQTKKFNAHVRDVIVNPQIKENDSREMNKLKKKAFASKLVLNFQHFFSYAKIFKTYHIKEANEK